MCLWQREALRGVILPLLGTSPIDNSRRYYYFLTLFLRLVGGINIDILGE